MTTQEWIDAARRGSRSLGCPDDFTEFLDSIQQYYDVHGTLTEKQLQALKNIYNAGLIAIASDAEMDPLWDYGMR